MKLNCLRRHRTIRRLVPWSSLLGLASLMCLHRFLDTLEDIENPYEPLGRASYRIREDKLMDPVNPKDKWIPAFVPDDDVFNIPRSRLSTAGIPLTNLLYTLTKDHVSDFVFVTAADPSYYRPCWDAIATVQKYFPGRKIIFYDLARTMQNNVRKLVRSFCDVEYRQFPFSRYPDHVTKLKTYSWKPLIIHTVLQTSNGVFWFDSSVRFLSGNLTDVFSFVLSTGGAMLFNFAGHNTFSVTHERTYHFLPTNLTEMQNIFQYEANIMLLYKSRSIYNDVILWWVKCALVADCIAPILHLGCRFRGSKVYARCHRYDQSAINILLANKFKFDYRIFAKHLDNFEVIKRYHSGDQKNVYCNISNT